MNRTRLAVATSLFALIACAHGTSSAFEVPPPTVDPWLRNTPARPFGYGYGEDACGYTGLGRQIWDGMTGTRLGHTVARIPAYAAGRRVVDAQDRSIALSGLLRCTPAQLAQGDLGACTALREDADVGDLTRRAWITARSSWSQSVTNEHMEITQVALKRAGLPAELTDRKFLVRYPAAKRIIASPIAPSAAPNDMDGDGAHDYADDCPMQWGLLGCPQPPEPDDFDSDGIPNASDACPFAQGAGTGCPPGMSFVAAPSLEPADFSDDVTWATRWISLPEMASLPDMAPTVWDWATGYERCALQGFEGVAGPHGDVNACHVYSQSVGPANVTHFGPVGRAMYMHYHELARRRMDECTLLSTRLGRFYPDGALSTRGYAGPYGTEAHECEREAFVYEMVAVHYLEDAWSSGHMWSAWGEPQGFEFPERLPNELGLTIAPENAAARRSAIAGMRAGYVGIFHGTKVVTGVDDVLGYPDYGTALDWHSVQAVLSDGTKLDAAGDLYWAPKAGPSLQQARFAAQRERMLGCVASSVRDVYSRGPMGFGAPGVGSGGQVGPNPLEGQDCWPTGVANRDMAAARGLAAPVDLLLKPSLIEDFPTASLVFKLVANAALPAVTFKALQHKVFDPLFFPNRADRDVFLKRLRDQWLLDDSRITSTFFSRAVSTTLLQTLSAQMIELEPADKLTFLGVKPAAKPATLDGLILDDTDKWAHLDQPKRRPGRENDAFVPRLFWRSHLRETCNDGARIAPLRERCTSAAEAGGTDVNACTACAALAEMHLRTCDFDASRPMQDAVTMRPSKCEEVAGVDRPAQLQTADPAAWLVDPTPVTYEAAQTACASETALRALRYCAGDDRAVLSTRSYAGQSPGAFVDKHLRVFALTEDVDTTVPTPWAYALNEHLSPDGQSSLQPWADAISAPLPGSDLFQQTPAFVEPWSTSRLHGVWPFCGLTQRHYWTNRSCETILPQLAAAHPETSEALVRTSPDLTSKMLYIAERASGFGVSAKELPCSVEGLTNASVLEDGGVTSETSPDPRWYPVPGGSCYTGAAAEESACGPTTQALARCEIAEPVTYAATCPVGLACTLSGTCGSPSPDPPEVRYLW